MPGAPLPAKSPVQQYLEALAGMISLSPAEKQALSAAEGAYRDAVSAAAKQRRRPRRQLAAEAAAADRVTAVQEDLAQAQACFKRKDWVGFAKMNVKRPEFRSDAVKQLAQLPTGTRDPADGLSPVELYLEALTGLTALNADELSARKAAEQKRMLQKDLGQAQACFKRKDYVGFAKINAQRREFRPDALKELLQLHADSPDELSPMEVYLEALAGLTALNADERRARKAVEQKRAELRAASVQQAQHAQQQGRACLAAKDYTGFAKIVAEHDGFRPEALKQLAQLTVPTPPARAPIHVYLDALSSTTALDAKEQQALDDAKREFHRASVVQSELSLAQKCFRSKDWLGFAKINARRKEFRPDALKQLSQLHADSPDELSPVEVYLEALTSLTALNADERRARTEAQQARAEQAQARADLASAAQTDQFKVQVREVLEVAAGHFKRRDYVAFAQAVADYEGIRPVTLKQVLQRPTPKLPELAPVYIYLKTLADLGALTAEEQQAYESARESHHQAVEQAKAEDAATLVLKGAMQLAQAAYRDEDHKGLAKVCFDHSGLRGHFIKATVSRKSAAAVMTYLNALEALTSLNDEELAAKVVVAQDETQRLLREARERQETNRLLLQAQPGSPEAILVTFYAKHEPDFANMEKVSKITGSFRKKAAQKGGDWEEMMYAAMTKQRGEDPRTVYAELHGAEGAEPEPEPEPEPAVMALPAYSSATAWALEPTSDSRGASSIDEAVDIVMQVKGMPPSIEDTLRRKSITKRALLAMSRDSLKALGITRIGPLSLLVLKIDEFNELAATRVAAPAPTAAISSELFRQPADAARCRCETCGKRDLRGHQQRCPVCATLSPTLSATKRLVLQAQSEPEPEPEPTKMDEASMTPAERAFSDFYTRQASEASTGGAPGGTHSPGTPLKVGVDPRITTSLFKHTWTDAFGVGIFEGDRVQYRDGNDSWREGTAGSISAAKRKPMVTFDHDGSQFHWDEVRSLLPNRASESRRNPVWRKDDDHDRCLICEAEFGMLTRRHHCRACGWVVCDDCSDNRKKLRTIMKETGPYRVRADAVSGPYRVCDLCL